MGTLYAEIADARRLGLWQRAFVSDDTSDLESNLQAASDEASSYLGNKFVLPLSSWGDDLRAAVSKIAVYEFLSTRGFNPEPGTGDWNILKRAEQARQWLRDVGAGKATPIDVIDGSGATPPAEAGAPEVVTASQRGWSDRGNPGTSGPFVSD